MVATFGGVSAEYPGRILTWTNQRNAPFDIADLDKDGDVDLTDFSIFQQQFTGSL